jgi:hypothetical protein
LGSGSPFHPHHIGDAPASAASQKTVVEQGGACDSQGNCSYTGYSSGEISLPAGGVVFGKKLESASLKTTINLYSWEDEMQVNPLPFVVDLAWAPTGEKPYQISDVYHRTTTWEMVRERVKETVCAAFVSGTIEFQDVTNNLGPDSTNSSQLIADRIGDFWTVRKH